MLWLITGLAQVIPERDEAIRVGKEIAIQRTRINIDLDVFNILNQSTVLGREYDFRLTTFDNVKEIMNPRVLRLGLRFGF